VLLAMLGVAYAPQLLAKLQRPVAAATATPVAPRPALVAVPISQGEGLEKFEPANGCFLGAYVSQDWHIGGDMRRWEKETRKGHASYLRYVGYMQPFPTEWVRELRAIGAAPHIAWEPNAGLWQVQDDEYLRSWARVAAASGGPIFLRFASEMNGNWTNYHGVPKLYREKFRMVARVMREEAPNVAMVWCCYATPADSVEKYYPGDEAVDWVGINLYGVHHHNGDPLQSAEHEDPLRFIEPFYRRFAPHKPIQLSEFAVTHQCDACKQIVPRFAINKMERLYGNLRRRYPRVKGVYWFSWDTLGSGSAENNYSVVDDPTILSAYRRSVVSDYFLPRLPEGRFWATRPNPALAVAQKP
jgi:hypothetical protein